MIAVLLSLVSCYDDYTMDYEHSAAYVAYQYDLRTFVIGEGMKFDFTVALGGVRANDKDRSVSVSVDDALLEVDLSAFSESQQPASFTALDGLLGNAGFGHISQNYVSQEVKASEITSLTPLPHDYYDIYGLEGLKIQKGRHTASVTIKADESFASDKNAFKPYYALGFVLKNADADMIIKEKSFAVIVVKCEHMLYGNWYYGGSSQTVETSTGAVLDSASYPLTLPQSDDKVKTLKTISADCVELDSPYAGRIRITVDGAVLTVSAVDPSIAIGTIDGEPSSYNQARLLQNRCLYLNYTVDKGDGKVTYVRDYLQFRNRIRDGVNEWQDENPENYN